MRTYWVAFVLSLLTTADAFAHAMLKANANGLFVPRNAIANKIGPCGSARGTTPSFLIAGSQVQVTFEEFIEHPGRYRISFSPNGDVFPDPFATVNANILLDNIPDMTGATSANPNIYTRTITVPSTPCDHCTLQLIQYMTENNPPSLYFSCADIVILPAGSALPTPNPSPTPLVGGGGTSGTSGTSGGASSGGAQPSCP